jgi:hypothetical protein
VRWDTETAYAENIPAECPPSPPAYCIIYAEEEDDDENVTKKEGFKK